MLLSLLSTYGAPPTGRTFAMVSLTPVASNKYASKPGDEIQIGYAGKSCTITLARFCYAFLHGYARLYSLLCYGP